MLEEFAKSSGLDVSGAELIKFTNNAVYRLPASQAVLRIAGSETMRGRITKVIAVAQWLESMDFPAVRLMPNVSQPLLFGDHVATVWQMVDSSGASAGGADLGYLLRRFHSLPPPNVTLPPWQPLTGIRSRLATPSTLVDASDLQFLQEKCDEVEFLLDETRFVLPGGPIHGDSFVGNLISSPTAVILCDFDSTSNGPREWDLTPAAVGRVRFDYATDVHGPLADIYGFDVMAWEGFATLRQLRELQLVTSVIPVLDKNPAIVSQWRRRLNSFRSGATDVRWSTYR
ncbi:aminoglycoside phosphotransferase family protein [Micromonospora sp. NPDC005324]|uniref:aminoglycoside phosphotransferase family protein n=1 Tax=Micromonospora sp. NPDC005324 TaxID=3157033 RepID=UPI0033B530DC